MNRQIQLMATSDNDHVDAALRQIIAALEHHLPARVSGYYLVGSYATGEAIAASDIDLLVVLKDTLMPADQHQLDAVRLWWRGQGALPLDLIVQGEAGLRRTGGVWFQTASRLLYGADIRLQIRRKPVELHTRDLLHAVFPLLTRLRHATATLTVPLDFPDSDAPFYGYTRRYTSSTEPPRDVGTKDIVNLVLAIANALTLEQVGDYVGRGRKSDIPQEYRRVVGDAWGAFVQTIYDMCRRRWDYVIPAASCEQDELRRLCQQVLAFENHFLLHYQRFLDAELRHPDLLIVQRAAQRRQCLHPRNAT